MGVHGNDTNTRVGSLPRHGESFVRQLDCRSQVPVCWGAARIWLDPNAPWPVRRGGIVLTLYEHSLSLTLLALFFTSWWLHATAGYDAHAAEALAHGKPHPSFGSFVSSAEFWFQTGE